MEMSPNAAAKKHMIAPRHFFRIIKYIRSKKLIKINDNMDRANVIEKNVRKDNYNYIVRKIQNEKMSSSAEIQPPHSITKWRLFSEISV